MNHIIIVGNVGADPEIKTFDGGNVKALITVAVTNKFKDKKTGELQTETDWFRVVAWNNLAKFLDRHTKKGNKVLISGKIKFRSFEKEGQKQYITELWAERVEQLTWNEKPEQESNYQTPPPTGNYTENDDLPF